MESCEPENTSASKEQHNEKRRNNLAIARQKLAEQVAAMRVANGKPKPSADEHKQLIMKKKAARKEAAAKVEETFKKSKLEVLSTTPQTKHDEDTQEDEAERAESDSDTDDDEASVSESFASALSRAKLELKEKYKNKYQQKYNNLTATHIDMAQRVLEKDTLRKAAVRVAEDRLKDTLTNKLLSHSSYFR